MLIVNIQDWKSLVESVVAPKYKKMSDEMTKNISKTFVNKNFNKISWSMCRLSGNILENGVR